MRRLSVLVIAVSALVLAVAACGGDGDSAAPAPAEPAAADSGGASTEVALAAVEDGSFAYETTALDATAGEITIAFTNPSATPHNVAVEGEGIETVAGEIVAMADAPITLSLEPGTYTFFCSVPGHRDAGMEGTLTVS